MRKKYLSNVIKVIDFIKLNNDEDIIIRINNNNYNRDNIPSMYHQAFVREWDIKNIPHSNNKIMAIKTDIKIGG